MTRQMKQEETRTQLAARLQLLRRERGLSQQSVADHLGLSRSSIVEMEAGQRGTKVEELLSLATYYQVEVNTLLGIRTQEQKAFFPEIRTFYLLTGTELRALITQHFQRPDSSPIQAEQWNADCEYQFCGIDGDLPFSIQEQVAAFCRGTEDTTPDMTDLLNMLVRQKVLPPGNYLITIPD